MKIYLYTDCSDEYTPIHGIDDAPKSIHATKDDAIKHYETRSWCDTSTIFEIDLELMSIKTIWHNGEDLENES